MFCNYTQKIKFEFPKHSVKKNVCNKCYDILKHVRDFRFSNFLNKNTRNPVK